jgi:hypothetical protein
LYALLAKQVNKYTSGDSSSVPVERAQHLLESICYCIGAYLKTIEDMELKLNTLKEESIEQLFSKGQELVRLYVKKSKDLLNTLKLNALSVNNYAYHDTIFDGIADFFKDYDCRFGAQDSPGNIDYPLSKDVTDLSGVEYLYEYLEQLTIENDFCRKFSSESIEKLLRGYSDSYKEDLMNIYEPILANLLGRALLSKDLTDLNITEAERMELQQRLENCNKEQLLYSLNVEFDNICTTLKVTNNADIDYLRKAIIPFSQRLKQNLLLGKLDALFITLKEEPQNTGVYYQDGDQMQDDKLRELIETIRECEMLEDKIRLVQNNIRSLTDLVEVLPECFFEQEFQQVFEAFDVLELKVLWKYISQQQEIVYSVLEDAEQWQQEFIKYVDALGNDRKSEIMEV